MEERARWKIVRIRRTEDNLRTCTTETTQRDSHGITETEHTVLCLHGPPQGSLCACYVCGIANRRSGCISYSFFFSLGIFSFYCVYMSSFSMRALLCLTGSCFVLPACLLLDIFSFLKRKVRRSGSEKCEYWEIREQGKCGRCVLYERRMYSHKK